MVFIMPLVALMCSAVTVAKMLQGDPPEPAAPGEKRGSGTHGKHVMPNSKKKRGRGRKKGGAGLHRTRKHSDHATREGAPTVQPSEPRPYAYDQSCHHYSSDYWVQKVLKKQKLDGIESVIDELPDEDAGALLKFTVACLAQLYSSGTRYQLTCIECTASNLITALAWPPHSAYLVLEYTHGGPKRRHFSKKPCLWRGVLGSQREIPRFRTEIQLFQEFPRILGIVRMRDFYGALPKHWSFPKRHSASLTIPRIIGIHGSILVLVLELAPHAGILAE